MAKNDLILLDGILSEYKSNKFPTYDDGEILEYFATEQILKDYAFTHEQILSGSVDGRNDGGIDEFFVLVNGHLAENIPDEFWPKTNAELDVYIITCKHDDSFRQQPINTMIPSLLQLLDFRIKTDTLRNQEDSYNEKVLRKRELLISTYRRLAFSLTKFDLHLIYACRGDEVIEPNIQAKADQAVGICQDAFRECTATFDFCGNGSLIDIYRKHAKKALTLKYEQCINQNGQYVLLALLEDYCKFITDSRGKLNKHLFDANVRDYLGLNPVNTDILQSLQQNNGPDFWWLNNGITIIGSKATIVGNAISIEDVKIVNGLQTSESIYRYFSNNQGAQDNRQVLLKILITNDSQICDDIIYATNNQTNVNVTALRSTDRIQYDIEQVLKNHDIYYERRTNYYQNQGISASAIITPLSLAAGCVTLIYKNPYCATSLKQKFMRDDKKYNKIFSGSMDLNVWVVIAQLIQKTDSILTEAKPSIGKKMFKFQKNYRQIVMFVTVSRLLGTYAFSAKQLLSFDMSRYTKDEVCKTLGDFEAIKTDCFSGFNKLKAEFYAECYQRFAEKYSITAIQAIKAANQKLWNEADVLSANSLTEEIVESVRKKLPEQPWPINTHKAVAQELGISPFKVSAAIGYMLNSHRINYQVYGFVFDDHEHIIAEGAHYGHTEADARAKLKEQKQFNAEKYSLQI